MLRNIGGRPVGRSEPVFVIAEIGLNHGGSVERALRLVDGAAAAGASAVKLQTLRADRLVAASCPPPAHVAATSLREFFARFELSLGAHRAVVAHARARGLAVMTTPFSLEVLPLLEELHLDAYKIASGDLTFDGLIASAAATGRPLVISTGMSSMPEIRHALSVAGRAGGREIAVLHCVSAYPAPRESENLLAVRTLAETFGLPAGLSDHGSGLVSAVAAVALGAVVYERHLVLEGDDDAIDRPVSSTPEELRAIVAALEHTRIALGTGRKACGAAEAANVTASRRGLYAARAMRAGEALAAADVVALRPATSLSPSSLREIAGATLLRDIAAGEPFHAADFGAVEAASGSAAGRMT